MAAARTTLLMADREGRPGCLELEFAAMVPRGALPVPPGLDGGEAAIWLYVQETERELADIIEELGQAPVGPRPRARGVAPRGPASLARGGVSAIRAGPKAPVRSDAARTLRAIVFILVAFMAGCVLYGVSQGGVRW